MKTFEIQYPANTRYQNQRYSENLLGDRSRTINYTTPDGAFSVHKTEQGYSSMYINKETGRVVTQDIRNNFGDVFSSKVTTITNGEHSYQTIQTLKKDGSYEIERLVNGIRKNGHSLIPEDRSFKGLKGFIQKAIIYITTDINGCENAKIAPIARKLLTKIRHL